MIQSIIMGAYYLMSAFVAFILIREIFRTKNIQEVVLFSIILVPFLLRVLHIK
jgi:hypothetical protein